jgi:hypothetical protein
MIGVDPFHFCAQARSRTKDQARDLAKVARKFKSNFKTSSPTKNGGSSKGKCTILAHPYPQLFQKLFLTRKMIFNQLKI